MVKGAVRGDVGGAGLGFGAEQGRHRMVQAWAESGIMGELRGAAHERKGKDDYGGPQVGLASAREASGSGAGAVGIWVAKNKNFCPH